MKWSLNADDDINLWYSEAIKSSVRILDAIEVFLFFFFARSTCWKIYELNLSDNKIFELIDTASGI